MGFTNPEKLDETRKGRSFGTRHTQCILLFLGMVFSYFQRVNIATAIVPMTQKSTNFAYYNWTAETKGLIQSSFFWGYVIAQVPAGLLAKRFGAKFLLGLCTIGGSILAFFHPLAADHGYIYLCVLRAITGLLQGAVYPCMHTLLAKWVPRTERSFLSTTVYSGAQLGTTIIMAISGFVFESKLGWPGLFYLSGAVSLAWAIAYLSWGANTPAEVHNICKAELDFIEKLTGGAQNTKTMVIPWRAIFTSLPFYGLIAAHCGFTWGFYILLTQIPSYMSKALHLDYRSYMLMALPYFAMWLLCLIVSPISDLLINRNVIRVTTARKLFNSIGQWLPMGCLIALAYMTANERTLAIMLLTIGVGFNAASFCGYLVNHMDLSPNFAGPMMGITNGFSNLLSAFGPIVVGYFVKNEADPSEWRIIFFITSGIYLLSNLLFIVFGQATIQPWNDPAMMNSMITLRENPEHISKTVLPTNNDSKTVF